MFVNIGSREFLTPFEIALLVNGIIAAIAEDRYVGITIMGQRQALRQFALVTRLGLRCDPQENMVTLVESG